MFLEHSKLTHNSRNHYLKNTKPADGTSRENSIPAVQLRTKARCSCQELCFFVAVSCGHKDQDPVMGRGIGGAGQVAIFPPQGRNKQKQPNELQQLGQKGEILAEPNIGNGQDIGRVTHGPTLSSRLSSCQVCLAAKNIQAMLVGGQQIRLPASLRVCSGLCTCVVLAKHPKIGARGH